MTATEGFKKLKALLGPSAAYKEYKWRTSPEQRDAARQRASELSARYDAVKAKREARQAELLSDPLYQQLVAEAAQLRKDRNEALAQSHRYRLTVGKRNDLFFLVRENGDNWADVIRKLENRDGK